MFGRVLNTLKYRVAREEADWLKQNELFRRNRYSLVGRFLLASAQRPARYAIGALILGILVSWDLTCWTTALDPSFACWSAEFKLDLWSDAKKDRLVSLFIALWALQGSLAGLVYPIVISFVALLIQRSAGARLITVYFQTTAAIFAGLSALMLVLLMLCQYTLITVQETLVEGQTIALWLAIDSVWFALNLGITGIFLFRTFAFLTPTIRRKTVNRYVLAEVWRSEVRRKWHPLLLLLAQRHGWLPGPDGHEDNTTSPSVLVHELGGDRGATAVHVSSGKARVISDIFFRPLSLAIALWKWRAARARGSLPDEKPWPVIIFPAIPGRPYDARVDLCRVEGAPPLTAIERVLVRRSFWLSNDSTHDAGDAVAAYFDELIGEIRMAMQSGHSKQFDEAVFALVDLHGLLVNASEYRADNGNPDNYVLIPEDLFWGRSTLDTWAQAYRSLFEEGVRRLDESEQYFNRLCYVPVYLLARCRDSHAPAVRESAVRLGSLLSFILEKWWTRRVEQQGALHHSACLAAALTPPFRSIHDDALRQFIGAWESLRNDYFMPSRRRATKDWSEFQEWWSCYALHLDETATMILRSVAAGDKMAAEWLCDSLSRWSEHLEMRHSEWRYALRRRSMVTLSVMSREAPTIEVLEFTVGRASVAEHVFAVAIFNYYTDVSVTTACILLNWGRECACDQATTTSILRSLVHGTRLREGESSTRGERGLIESPSDILESLVRQHFSEGDEGAYRNRLDALAERLADLRRAERVSGRIYSSRGIYDLDSLLGAQATLLALASRTAWSGVSAIEGDIARWVASDDQRVRSLQDLLTRMLDFINSEGFDSYKSVFECASEKEADFHSARTNAISALAAARDLISSLRDKALKDREVSPQRLEEVARAAGLAAFGRDTADFPVSFFSTVASRDEGVALRTLTLQNMNKGEFTAVQMASAASNEAEWLRDTMRDHVAAVVMASALQRASIAAHDTSDPLLYWQRLSASAAKLTAQGLSPVLLIDNATRPDWVWDWQHSDIGESDFFKRPADMSFTIDEASRKNRSYVGHFNNIAVFTAPLPFGSSYVTARELFERVEFHRFESGLNVQAAWQQSATDFARGDIQLSWGVQVALGRVSIDRLVYASATAGKLSGGNPTA